ncbi:MAG: PD-(D/E)XK nuclease family protein [Dehalococcoidia bacterium]
MTGHGIDVEFHGLDGNFVSRLGELIASIRSTDPLGAITVVTPSFYASYFLRRSLASVGLFNVDFVRIEDVAERLGEWRLTSGASPRRPLKHLQASEFVYAAVQSASLTGGLQNVREHPALHRALHRTFEDLRFAGEPVAERLLSLGRHYPDLLSIWRGYMKRSTEFYERLDVSLAAVEEIQAPESKPLRALGRLIVLLVSTPPPQYRPLWEALAQQAPGAKVMAGLTGDEGADRWITDLLPASPQHGSAPPAPSPSQTHLVSAPDRDQEVRWVVRNVVRLAQDENVRLGRIAVLYMHDPYGTRVEEAMRLAGIPVAGPDRTSLAEQIGGRFVTGLLRIIDKDFARDAVAAWLTAVPVCNPADGKPVPGSRWDAISRSAGVTRSMDGWRRQLDEFARKKDRDAAVGEREGGTDELLAEARRSEGRQARSLLAFIQRLASDAAPPESGGWRELADWMASLISRYLRPASDHLDDDSVEKVEGILARVADLEGLGEGVPGFQRFRFILLEEIDRPEGNVRSLGRGVFVAPARDAVGCSFDAVHMLGMAEGMFPGADRPDPLLPDADRMKIAPHGDLLPTRPRRVAETRRRYLTALATAPDRYLLWPRSESGAQREWGPAAWFVEEARKVPGNESIQAGHLLRREGNGITFLDAAERSLHRLDRPGDVHEYDIRSAAAWCAAGRTPAEHFLASETTSPLGMSLVMEAARSGRSWTSWDGDLTASSSGLSVMNDSPTSPTKLETWARCPFQFFLNYVLHVEPTEYPEDLLMISGQDRGILVHRILERFVSARSRLADTSDEEQQRLLLETTEQTLDEWERVEPVGHRAIWRIEREIIPHRLYAWLGRESKLIKALGISRSETEFRFGVSSGGAVAEIALGGERKIPFRGVIDRIDFSADGQRAVVFDYKTGSAKRYSGLKDDPVDHGRLLQLAIYSQAVLHAFPEVSTVSAAYWFVFESGNNEHVPAPHKFDFHHASKRLREVSETIATGIDNGIFPARPGRAEFSRINKDTFHNCGICSFDRVCHTGRAWMWERKSADDRLSSFVDLTGDVEMGG